MRNVLFIACVAVAIGCGKSEPEPPSLAQLETLLESTTSGAQMEAAAWAQQMGPKASPLAPSLLKALASATTPPVKQSLILALSKVGPEPSLVIPAFTKALSDEDYHVRKTAADALGSLGPAAVSAVSALEELSRKPDPCNSASNALKKIQH